ncbi:hypothetical protein RJ640_025914 [Escallonia rubra]|uniref:Small ribosomal subunit protein bS18c n=1 Tax=Escallonia rubra TaxID=112253 RepID=A0AA88RGL0_9ASTE|nr:hypothetical protein RJ640_025914 [Escallonia rubra]
MRLVQGVLRAVKLGSSLGSHRLPMARAFSGCIALSIDYWLMVWTYFYAVRDDNQSTNASASADDFEPWIFGNSTRSGQDSNSFFRKLDKAKKAHDMPASGSKSTGGKRSEFLDGLDESFSTLSDGMDGKLKEAATFFELDEHELEKDDYCYRPDMHFTPGMTYETKDLDLRKPGVQKFAKRNEFEVTSAEVLKKADFRNVRFLANFITQAGIIIKRSETKISAKAQRKVAREIKTARAFGLMPFTCMGTKRFVFGKTMEDLDEDFEYETYGHNFVDEEASQDPLEM